MEKLVTLVIPIYNEEDSVRELIQQTMSLEVEFPFLSTIFVNNGSTDNTKIELEKLSKIYSFKQLELKDNMGYGGGILEGINSSSTKIVGWTHADLQITQESIRNSLLKIQSLLNMNNDEFFIKGIRSGRKISERTISYFMGLIASIIHFKKFRDINGQPTFFNKNLVNNFRDDSIPKDFNLDFYFYYIALNNKSDIYRTKTTFIDRKYGESKWNINIISKIRFIANTLIYIIKIKKSHEN
tara:strand:+ start:754 stop:1476 length:723 start_codon:yes stop_codon:yes gene_type:complete